MGDAADYLTDSNSEAWLAHRRGECPWGCQYCVEEEEAAEEQERAASRVFMDWPCEPPY